MELLPIRTFADFCADLLTAGFAMGGGNDEGVFSLAPGWGNISVIIPATRKPIPGSGASGR